MNFFFIHGTNLGEFGPELEAYISFDNESVHMRLFH
jgi:hypothetical protein